MRSVRFFLILMLAAIWAAGSAMPSRASGGEGVTVTGSASVDFPVGATFTGHVESSAAVTRVVLEYGVEKQTCGTVIGKGFPQFTPGMSVDVSWTWDMHKSGSEPPGARIWYRWRAWDEAGREGVSDKQVVLWQDGGHTWGNLQQGDLNLHWYGLPDYMPGQLLSSAEQSLKGLSEATGVAPKEAIDLYIYPSYQDLRKAVLYEPGWVGGLAFPDYNIVLLGIEPSQLEWGKTSVAHELTHVLVGQLAFSCLSNIPTWLDEGIAMHGQGGPDPSSVSQFEKAVRANQLVSLHVLSGSFSERPDRADLAYSESYSVVRYLIKKHGRAKLNALFTGLSQGAEVEEALKSVYGFGLDQLEADWRRSIGAQASEAAPRAATPAPTPVPTLSVSSAPASFEEAARYTGDQPQDPSRLWLAALAVVVPLFVAGTGFYLALRRSRRG